MSSDKNPSQQGKAFNLPLMSRLLKYTRPYRAAFYFALILTILSAVLAPLRPRLFQDALDGPVMSGDFAGLNRMMVFVLVLLMVQTLTAFGASFLTGWLGQSVIRDIRREVFSHILSMRLRYYDKTAIGTLQTRTISDVETLNDVFSQGIVNILGDLLQVVAIVGFMFFSSVKLTLVVLGTLPFLFVATWLFGKKVRSSFAEVRKYVSQMNAFLQEHITGMLVTQLYNREKREEEKFRKINLDHTRANLNSVFYYSVFFPVVDLVSSLGIALLIWFGVGIGNTATFGELTAFIMYVQMFFRPVRMLAEQFNTLQLGMVSAERIFVVLDNDDSTQDSGTLISPLAETHTRPAIEFDQVWFGYNEGEWVLKNVTFSVARGEKVAIVGFTGAGKSTIISLLMRFYDFNRGNIFIHGSRIEEYKLATLRSRIGLVLQDVFLFSGTILENITLNHPDISREKAIRAAELVGADAFISMLPGTYDWQVQERGATLSAGQRQLISFARVLAYDPEMLILDEATSSVDTDSEQMIQRAIDTVMKDRTSIIIAHRLSTIRKADKIIVMSKGEIVQQGTHDSLLEQDGLYQKLYRLQFAEV